MALSKEIGLIFPLTNTRESKAVTDSKYSSLGASASKAGVHAALESLQLRPESDLFCKIDPDIAGDPAFASFVHGDGAGTKSIVAYLAYRETGDPKYFRSLAQDSLVMNLDDILCLGIPARLALSNAIARNYHLIPDEAVREIIGGYLELVEKVRSFGIDIELSGGETADCGDIVRTLVVDSTLSGRIKNENLIRLSRVTKGDVIVGLSSAGRATYETDNNSGIGSNGLTLARHALLKNSYAKKYPEIVSPESDPSATYQGPFALEDTPDGLGMTVGQALLSPTRTFAPILLKVYRELGEAIHGVIHLTGGAHTKILRFGNRLSIEKHSPQAVPTIFRLIQQHAKVSLEEMYRVFNMGTRIEIYLPEKNAAVALAIAQSFGIDAKIVGEVVSDSAARSVTIHTAEQTLSYQLQENA